MITPAMRLELLRQYVSETPSSSDEMVQKNAVKAMIERGYQIGASPATITKQIVETALNTLLCPSVLYAIEFETQRLLSRGSMLVWRQTLTTLGYTPDFVARKLFPSAE